MRVFVTGGTGFLGRRVVQRLLAQGHQVRVLARNPDKAAAVKALGAEIVLGDLGNIDAFKSSLRDCECVVLVGARAISSGKWEEFVLENVVANERMIDEAVAAGARRIVYVSSRLRQRRLLHRHPYARHPTVPPPGASPGALP